MQSSLRIRSKVVWLVVTIDGADSGVEGIGHVPGGGRGGSGQDDLSLRKG